MNMRKKRLGDIPLSRLGRIVYGLFLLVVLAVAVRSIVMML